MPLLKPISSLQPSQLYISEEKLAAVNTKLTNDINSYDPIPIKLLDKKIVITDGHTRLYALNKLGIKKAKVIWDEDELNWDLYKVCVKWCLSEKITTISDLDGRILNRTDYQKLWIDRCERMWTDHSKL
ncbi:MAG: hypothetical protein JXR69_10545 [Candidatus Delongbacteria bacterium]|nr:hypothetical protein [Candidatus Delongbacteria bacterium]